MQLQLEVIFAVLPRMTNLASSITNIQQSPSAASPTSSKGLRETVPVYARVTNRSTLVVEAEAIIFANFENTLVGSMLILQQPLRRSKAQILPDSRRSQYQMKSRYCAPGWLSYRAWQLCSFRSQIGWTWTLTTYNIIPDYSPQFHHAEMGQLLDLQIMITNGKASIFDQQRDGDTLLSVRLSNPSLTLFMR